MDANAEKLNDNQGSYLYKENIRKNILLYGIMLICFIIIGLAVPSDFKESAPWISLLPAAFLVVYIFKTKRIMEALLLSVVLGCIIGYKFDFISIFGEIVYEAGADEDLIWNFTVCGMMGGLVAVVEKSGGGFAFSRFVSKRAKTAKQALLWTCLCSLLISIDEFLNILTTGSAMRRLNDKYKTPREMQAYTIDSMGTPVVVFNPISTWAVFIGSLLVANGVGGSDSQVLSYIKLIPFNFYAVFAVIVLILVILGVIPKIGPMKKAYERVENGGALAPEGSEKIDIKAGEEMKEPENPKLYNFFAPIVVLVASTIFFDFDLQLGVIVAIAFGFIFFCFQGMDPLEYVDTVLSGIKNMVFVLILVAIAFMFANISERIGFIDYVVDIATANVSLQMITFVIFIIFAFTEFIMGISWGMYVIAIPIVVPVTLALGGDPLVSAGAVIAAGVWGSHCCFYSDATLLTSSAVGCDNFRHAITQIPYGLIAGGFAAISYLIFGFVYY